MSRSNGDGAEILAFDPARRSRDGGTRPRCTAEDGRPCRNHAGPSGFCRVHEPAPRDSGAGARDAGGAPRSAHPAGRSRAGDGLRGPAAAHPRGGAPAGLGDHRPARRRRAALPAPAPDRRLRRRRLRLRPRADRAGRAPAVPPLYRSYWRIRTSGLQHVPDEGGALLVANHSGALPFDAIMTKVAVLDDHPAHRHLRLLAADFALRMPVVGPGAQDRQHPGAQRRRPPPAPRRRARRCLAGGVQGHRQALPRPLQAPALRARRVRRGRPARPGS